MTTSTIQMTNDHLGIVLAGLANVVDGVREDQLDGPTPCTDMDVAELRRHILGWLDTFAYGFADAGGQAPRASIDGFETPSDPGGAVRSASEALVAAVAAGAAERSLKLGDNAMPGELALGMILWEYQVHGWDLAHATGQPWSPPEAAAAESLAFAPAMLTDEYRAASTDFGPIVAVPEDAPPFDRLLGFSGRDPGWTP